MILAQAEMHAQDMLNETLLRARLRLLQMHYESGVGHIGGNLSSLDIMLTLYHRVLEKDDVFILSKGHAAGALYVTLWSTGALTEEDLRRFHSDLPACPKSSTTHTSQLGQAK